MCSNRTVHVVALHIWALHLNTIIFSLPLMHGNVAIQMRWPSLCDWSSKALLYQKWILLASERWCRSRSEARGMWSSSRTLLRLKTTHVQRLQTQTHCCRKIVWSVKCWIFSAPHGPDLKLGPMNIGRQQIEVATYRPVCNSAVRRSDPGGRSKGSPP